MHIFMLVLGKLDPGKLGPRKMLMRQIGPGKWGPWKVGPQIQKYSYKVKLIHKYCIIFGRIYEIQIFTIYIEEYFEIKFILLLLDMFGQQLGDICVVQRDFFSKNMHILEYMYLLQHTLENT